MKFLDRRLMALVTAVGLSSSLLGQDADKLADGVIKNKPEAVDPEKVKKIDEILRQQNELEGDGLVLEAGELLKFSRFEEAAEKFESAIGKYKRVSKSEPAILKKIEEAEKQQSRALRLYADQLVKEAIENSDENSLTAFDKAIGKLQQAKKLDPTRSAEIDAQLKALDEKVSIYEHNDKVGKMRLEKEFRFDEQKGSIANGILFERAKIQYAHRRFIQAKTTLEQILTNQPFNEHAVNLLQRVNKKIFEAGRERRNTIYQEYLDEVEWKWSDPINAYRAENIIKSDVETVDQSKVLGGIYKKLQIVIPKVRFEDRDLDFVVDFIKRTTRDLDEEGEGLNVIVSVNDQAPAAAVDQAPVDDLDAALDAPIDGAPAAPAGGGGKKINLDADDIPVGEVIKYICDQLNLKYKVEEFAVIIGDNEKFQQLETNFYTISAGLLEIVETKTAEGIGNAGGGGGLGGIGGGIDAGGGGGPNFQAYFQQLGISFPPGARIKFVQGAMRLVVTNTPENHSKLEEILRQIGIETPQVSIESKFIEVNNTDIEELGVQWRVGRPNHLTNPNGIDHQALVGDPNNTGTANNPNINKANLSNGIRDVALLAGGAAGPVQAGVNLIMGDYIFQGLIRALEQESTSDVLSAPQVTAVSGKTAVIRIVEERYFPESWEAPEISTQQIYGSSPQFGEPRDVGIVFEVTPQVEPDGYTISLDLKPQVLEFLRYDTSYDSVINVGRNLPNPPDAANPTNMPVLFQMPILSARTIETRVTIWDGETIMLGGLVKETVTAVDDKVPYLSDIPLIGRVFRNKGQQSEKQNLLVFVTARLIDPAGLPKKPRNDKGLPDFKRL